MLFSHLAEEDLDIKALRKKKKKNLLFQTRFSRESNFRVINSLMKTNNSYLKEKTHKDTKLPRIPEPPAYDRETVIFLHDHYTC